MQEFCFKRMVNPKEMQGHVNPAVIFMWLALQ